MEGSLEERLRSIEARLEALERLLSAGPRPAKPKDFWGFETEVPRTLERVRRSQLTLGQELAKLGPPKSVERVRRFFPRFFRHFEGPRAGQRPRGRLLPSRLFPGRSRTPAGP